MSENGSQPAQRSERRARWFARLFGFALVLSMPVALLVADAGRVLFDPASLSRALARIAFETEALPTGLAWATQTFPGGNLAIGGGMLFARTPPLLRLGAGLETEEWTEVLAELLPPAAPAGWIEDSAHGLDRWLDGSGSLSEIAYDLAPVKARALSANGLRAARIAFAALPPCRNSQVPAELEGADVGRLDAGLLQLPCALPDPWTDDQFAAYAELVPEHVALVRSRVTLEQVVNPFDDPVTGAYLESARGALRLARTLTALAPAVPAALLAAILVLRVRTWSDLGTWWSPWLAAGGLVTMALALARTSILAAALDALPFEHELLTEALFQAASGLAAELAGPLLARGATAVMLAIALRVYAARLA